MSVSHIAPLSYFIEWGGKSWEKLLEKGIKYPGNFTNKKLLELGPRNGKMSSYFALQGAQVTGLDIREQYLTNAREEAKKWSVEIDFRAYNGDLSFIPDHSFDVIFTKSVLVMIKERDELYRQLHRVLKPGGKIVLLENGSGSFILKLIRAFRHRKWNHDTVRYFDASDINKLGKLFQLEKVQRTYLRPIYLVTGTKA